MYNLIVGMTDGVAFSSRLLEYTEDALKAQFTDASGVAVQRLVNLPTLLMPEIQEPRDPSAVARVGRVTAIRRSGRDYQFDFTPNPTVQPIPLTRIAQVATRLGVHHTFEWSRTHWAVKEPDLFEVVLEEAAGARLQPTAFSFPTTVVREPDLVAVMMPFAGFDPVYAAIKGAAEDAGLRCLRADDIWENQHIMDDVLSLIWRAQVIVSDFTGRNANVFYETGIAHSLGRPVVPITQTMGDVPFDLRAIRAQEYLRNSEGLSELRTRLALRLRSLA